MCFPTTGMRGTGDLRWETSARSTVRRSRLRYRKTPSMSMSFSSRARCTLYYRISPCKPPGGSGSMMLMYDRKDAWYRQGEKKRERHRAADKLTPHAHEGEAGR